MEEGGLAGVEHAPPRPWGLQKYATVMPASEGCAGLMGAAGVILVVIGSRCGSVSNIASWFEAMQFVWAGWPTDSLPSF